MSAKRWREGPVRILDVCPMGQDFAKIDLNKFNDLVKSFHANAVHFQCHDNYHDGMNPDVIYPIEEFEVIAVEG